MHIMAEEEDGKSRPNKITPNQIEFEGEEDRLSSLPDCLLIEIISRSDLKDAIKTSTLSKRWQHLWTRVPNLIFHRKHPHSPTKFLSIVDKTLTQCSRQSTLTRFVLVFTNGFDIRFESKINSWIRYAINRSVQEIDLSLMTEARALFVLDQLIFTNSCFTHLNFQSCWLNPTSAINWNNLKSLCVSRGKLHEDLIQNILCGSPFLETFKLLHCYGFRRLDITSKSVKNLVFAGYFDYECYNSRHVLDVEINAPYILSLTIGGDLVLRKVFLLNLTSLFEANLNFWKRWGYVCMSPEGEEMLERFLLNLQHVEEINIGKVTLRTLSDLKAKGFTCPTNVKYMDLPEYI